MTGSRRVPSFDTQIDSDLDWITLDIGMSDIVIQLRHIVLKAHKQLKSNTYKLAQLILKQTLFEFDHIGKKCQEMLVGNVHPALLQDATED